MYTSIKGNENIYIFLLSNLPKCWDYLLHSHLNALPKNTFLISSKLQLKSLISPKMYINCLSLQFSKFLKIASSREAWETWYFGTPGKRKSHLPCIFFLVLRFEEHCQIPIKTEFQKSLLLALLCFLKYLN